MPSYNRVILVGNLTRDPELSYLPNNQTAAVEFSLAVNRRWRGADGQNRDEVSYFDCRCYGKRAETLNQYVRKGNPILVEGRLQQARWEAQDGSKRSKVRVIIDNFQFLSSAPSGGSGGGYQQQQQQQRPPAQQQEQQQQRPPAQQQEPAPPQYDDAGGGDDIPF